MKKAVITGASGYVGRNLIRYLLSLDVEIYAICRKGMPAEFADCPKVHEIICELDEEGKMIEILSGVKADVLYHLAWQGAFGQGRADYELQMVNAKYTCAMARLSKKIGCKKFVTVGTISERLADNILNKKYHAQNLIYALTKNYTHKLLDIVCEQEKIDYVWAQLSNIYGGDDYNGNLISYTLKNFKAGNVPEYGPCTNYYDFIHIYDVAAALYKIGFYPTKYEEYFIGRGEHMLLSEYLVLVSKVFDFPIRIGVRPDDGLVYEEKWFDNSRLISDLNFEYKYTFEDGIREIKKEMERDGCVGNNNYTN